MHAIARTAASEAHLKMLRHSWVGTREDVFVGKDSRSMQIKGRTRMFSAGILENQVAYPGSGLLLALDAKWPPGKSIGPSTAAANNRNGNVAHRIDVL